MPYEIKNISPAEREAIIRKSSEASTRHETFRHFRNTVSSFPVIRIGINVPIYRMDNFRTFTNQKEFLRKEALESNYFSRGQEKDSVQQIQHRLLLALAKKGKEGSVTPVFDVLRKDKQQEALLITSSGVVVNGNRRLAAMRELFSENTLDTASFSHIDVMVLPADASEEDIIDIEASLQAMPETKLAYDWIGDAKLISMQVSIHKSNYSVAERLQRPEKEIKSSLQALVEAELYLKEWVKVEGDYSRVKDDAEQFFKDLPKSLQGKDRELENASRVIAWILFDNKDKLPSRIYDFNSAFGKLASDVLDRFSKAIGIEDSDISESEGDDFSIDIIEEDDQISYKSTIDVLKQPDNEEAVKALIECCQDAMETERGQKSGDSALKAINQSHSKMASVDLLRANPNTYMAIERQLDAIATIIAKLSVTMTSLKK